MLLLLFHIGGEWMRFRFACMAENNFQGVRPFWCEREITSDFREEVAASSSGKETEPCVL